MIQEEELRLCPFCGGEPQVELTYGELFITCNQCPARMRRLVSTRAEISGVIACWNQRYELKEEEGLTEKLQTMYDELNSIESEDAVETYTTGYRNGHMNGKIELLEYILQIPDGTVTDEAEQEGDGKNGEV